MDNQTQQKNKGWGYYLNKALNPSYNFWLYLFLVFSLYFFKLSKMTCLEKGELIIAEAIWVIILILCFKFWQDMYYRGAF